MQITYSKNDHLETTEILLSVTPNYLDCKLQSLTVQCCLQVVVDLDRAGILPTYLVSASHKCFSKHKQSLIE